MKNVLVLGAGRRVRGAVLPALWCLRERFALAAVVSRTAKEIPVAGGTGNSHGSGGSHERIQTRTSLDDVDLAGIDLVFVAVSLGEVPRVLADLARRDLGHAVLVLDTPVLPPAKLKATRLLRGFQRVLVAEDTIALPPFVLARRLIDAGVIGALRRIFFFHNGYKYHALASLKMLAAGPSSDRAPIRRLVSRKYGGKIRRKEIDLDGGVSAVLCEPRDYESGKFLIEGERGCIADYDYPVSPAQRIGYRLEGATYRGLTLNGEPVPAAGLDHAYLENIGDDVFDASPMNTMKLRGLMDLLVASLEENSPLHYSPAEAIADNLAILVADRLGWVPPPPLLERAALLVQNWK
jgi:hypothetical protein